MGGPEKSAGREKLSSRVLFSWLGLWLIVLVQGCGYRFSGDESGSIPALRHARIRVEGAGAWHDPLMARLLRQNLETRLGIEPVSGERPELVVRLDPVERIMHLEDRSGRADQYRITVQAQPQLIVGGKPVVPGYPLVKGVVVYNELRAVTASQSAREQAVSEALNQLTEELTAVMIGSF
ncbi:MAG: hypothetical protein HQL65_17020 [Magnetococcales bacterium]|nr:hypothetical protein [Magnetococcales bacterium]